MQLAENGIDDVYCANLTALSLLNKTYVYGFDEMNIKFNKSGG